MYLLRAEMQEKTADDTADDTVQEGDISWTPREDLSRSPSFQVKTFQTQPDPSPISAVQQWLGFLETKRSADLAGFRAGGSPLFELSFLHETS